MVPIRCTSACMDHACSGRCLPVPGSTLLSVCQRGLHMHNGRCFLIPGSTSTWILLQRWQMLPGFSPCPVHGWIPQGWQVHPTPPSPSAQLVSSSKMAYASHLLVPLSVRSDSSCKMASASHRLVQFHHARKLPRWSFPAHRRKLVHLHANCR